MSALLVMARTFGPLKESVKAQETWLGAKAKATTQGLIGPDDHPRKNR
jgi:hypothetical protein